MAYTEAERASAIEKVIEGLRKGTPLTVICSEDGMPCDDTVRDWADSDPVISRAIARAREAGWDAIAIDALHIADDNGKDTRWVGAEGEEREVADTEWISRSKLRVETRLKLLAKWDPKRYGEMLKHANADGENFDLSGMVSQRRQQVADGNKSEG